MTDSFKINSSRQPNGLFGAPIALLKLDRMIPMDFEKQLLQSAILVGIAQEYKDETFEVFFSTEKGFVVKLSENGYKKIDYKNYELVENTLHWRE